MLAYFCFVVAILLILIVFAVNNFEITDSVLGYAIGLAIAIIPEGLLVVVYFLYTKVTVLDYPNNGPWSREYGQTEGYRKKNARTGEYWLGHDDLFRQGNANLSLIRLTS